MCAYGTLFALRQPMGEQTMPKMTGNLFIHSPTRSQRTAGTEHICCYMRDIIVRTTHATSNERYRKGKMKDLTQIYETSGNSAPYHRVRLKT
jgi:hypothetical protein